MKENLSEETGLQQLQEDKLKHRKTPLIGYLNINSLRNKITDLMVIMKTLSLNYLILSETKIDESFPTSQFNIEGYGIRARRDRDKFGGGLIEFVRRGLICKRLRDYEPKYSECLCSELSETGLSDYHKLIKTFFKTNFSRLRLKVLSYRNYKNFIESKFLNDLNKTIISFDNENPNQNYNVLSNRFLEVVNVHALLKTKIVRGNNAPFVDKQLRKAIYPNQVEE